MHNIIVAPANYAACPLRYRYQLSLGYNVPLPATITSSHQDTVSSQACNTPDPH